MLKSKVAKNALYLMVLQLLNNLLPLLTIPYLVRVLSATDFGALAYSQVVFGYIGVICDYGFNLSSTRQFAINRNNIQKCNEVFNAVLVSKLGIMLICLGILTPCILYINLFAQYKLIYFLSYGIVLGQVLFPVWFFQGMEDMKIIVVLNSISKILFTVLIFVFVRNDSDLYMVPLFNAAGFILSGAIGIYLALRKYRMKFSLPSLPLITSQIKGGFDVFIPSFFSTVINNGGVFTLGLFYPAATVGYYSAVDKIIRAVMSFFAPVSQALFPDVAQRFKEDKNAARSFLIKVGGGVTVAIIFACILSYFIGPWLLTLLYGQEYKAYAFVLNVLFIWFLFGVINNFIGIQFLIGSGNGKVYRKAFVYAGIGTLLMYITIKYLAITGVVLSMLGGEVLLTIAMLFLIKRSGLNK